MPVNLGEFPAASVMEKTSVVRVDSGLLGSFRSFKVSSPVLMMVAATRKFAMSVTASGA